ncbi:hypothetical protein Q5692_30170 [Microcoleus sp. C2C3]|uniref:hypothetical protein n=1 Tax=unclassified Microcoleus TaxID=2642155 RepID=UPI002FD268C9
MRSQLETERADRPQVEAQLSDLQKRLDEAEENQTSDCELVEPLIYLNWLKGWVKLKFKKPQWEPTKTDAEELLKNAKKS